MNFNEYSMAFNEFSMIFDDFLMENDVFQCFQCISSYFDDLSMDDLEGIAGQYGINIQLDKRVPNNPAKAERTKIATIPIAITLDMFFI